jgi:hypothetical protein
MQELLPQPLGVDRVYSVTITDPTTGAAASFSSSDTLTCQIWGGDDTATLCSPTATWVSAAGGTAQFVVTAANTTVLSVGKYRVRLKATIASSGYTVAIWDGVIPFDSAPGTAAVLPSYCTYNQLTQIAPWVGDLASQLTDQNGFAEQRGMATQRIQEDLCKLYSNQQQSFMGYPSVYRGAAPNLLFNQAPNNYLRQVLAITTITASSVSGSVLTLSSPLTTAIVGGSILNFGGSYATTLIQANPGDTTIILLSAPTGTITPGTTATVNNLKITEATVRITAYYSLYLICDSQVSPSVDDTYAKHARAWFSKYSQAWCGYRAEILPNLQGYAAIVIVCGITSLRN